MTFERLDHVIERVLSRIDGLGEGATAIAPLRPKGTGTNAVPAKFQEGGPIPPAYKGSTDRCMTTAFPNELPRSAVVIHLRVIEGGRTTQGRKLGRPAYHSSPGGRASELKLRVIAGGRAAAREAIDVPHHSAPPDCIPNAVM